MTHTLELMPIDEAPVRAGRTFGPCVLDLGSRLRLGYWNGERWCDRYDEPIVPMRYAPLPHGIQLDEIGRTFQRRAQVAGMVGEDPAPPDATMKKTSPVSERGSLSRTNRRRRYGIGATLRASRAAVPPIHSSRQPSA